MENKLTICKKDLCVTTYGENAKLLKVIVTIVVVAVAATTLVTLVKSLK